MELNRKIAPPLGWNPQLITPHLEKECGINGCTLHYISRGDIPAVFLYILFPSKAETSHDKAIEQGVYDMMSQGSSHKSAFEIASTFDQVGTQFDSIRLPEHRGFRIRCTADGFKKSISMLREMIESPTYPDKMFDLWKAQKRQNITLMQQRASYVAMRALREALYEQYPRYKSYVDLQHIESTSVEQLRSYHSTQINSRECIIFACGPTNTPWLDDIRKEFLVESWGNIEQTKERKETIAEQDTCRCLINSSAQDQQASLIIGQLLPPAPHSDMHELLITTDLLGGYFGSRLMQNIREEKGYTYGIQTDVSYFSTHGLFSISAEIGNNYTAPSVKEIRYELEKLHTELISEDELERLRAYTLGKFIRGFDTGSSTLLLLRSLALNPGIGDSFIEEYLHTLAHITPKQIRDCAASWLRCEKMTLSIAGNIEQIGEIAWC